MIREPFWRRKPVKRVLIATPGIIGALAFAAQVTPNDARSHLAVWASWSLQFRPSWLTTSRLVVILVIVLGCFYAYVARKSLRQFWQRLLRACSAFRLDEHATVQLQALHERNEILELALTQRTRELKDVTQQLTEARGFCGALEMQCQQQVTALEGTVKVLTEERDHARDQLRKAVQASRYGRELLLEGVADTHEFAVMRASLQELKPVVWTLRDTLDQVWHSLLEMHPHEPQESARAWFLWYFANYPMKNALRALNAFVELADATDRDPRPALAGGYMAYRDWRKWLVDVLAASGRTPEDLPIVKQWCEAERAFFTDLGKKLGISALENVRTAIAQYDAEHAPMIMWTPHS